MKFKKISPGRIIHCSTQENAKLLLQHLDKLGYRWAGGTRIIDDDEAVNTLYENGGCYRTYSENGKLWVTTDSLEYYRGLRKKITEFDDLIEVEEVNTFSFLEETSDPKSFVFAAGVLEKLQKLSVDGLLQKVFGQPNSNIQNIEDVFAEFNPEEIILMMDAYEKAEKNNAQSNNNENEEPRICQILGVKPNEPWRIDSSAGSIYRINYSGKLQSSDSRLRNWKDVSDMSVLLQLVNHPESIVRKKKLAYVVMEMPDDCIECPFYKYDNDDCVCTYRNQSIPYESDDACRPDFCAWKYLPGKKDSGSNEADVSPRLRLLYAGWDMRLTEICKRFKES